MSYLSEVLADAPWGFWRLAETGIGTASDAGSNGVPFSYGTGVVLNKAALLADGGKAAAGSGSAPIASLGSVPASLSGANVTLEAWVNIPSGNVNGPIVIVGGASNNGWGMGVGGTTWDNVGKQLILVNEGIAWHPTSYTFSTGIHHVVAVRGTGGAVTAYVDGASVFTGTMAAPIAATTGIGIGGEVGTSRALSSTVDVDNVALFASALSATRVSAHYASGSGSNPALAADSPTAWIKLDETLSAFADASGGGRGLLPSGTVPTQGLPGPVASGSSIAYSTSAGYLATAAALGQPTTVTYEAWVYLSAYPATNTTLMTFGGSGSIGVTSAMTLTTAGKIAFNLYNGSSVDITSAAALSLNAWHHVVCSIGAAGAKIRVDKTTVASSASSSVNSATSGTLYVRNGGPNGPAGTGAVSIAEPAAWYGVQLADARTDAHYDAGVAGPAPTGTLAATLPQLTSSTSGTYGPSGSASVALPSLAADIEATFQLPGTSGDLTAALPSLAGSLSGSYALAGQLAATLPSLSGIIVGAVEVDATMAATLPSLTGSLSGILGDDFLIATLPSLQAAMSGFSLAVVGTDATVGSYGYSYAGSGVLDYDPPVTPEPAHGGRAHVRRIHRSMPTPTLTDGSPR